MKCPKCGKKVKGQFCPNCGTPVSAVQGASQKKKFHWWYILIIIVVIGVLGSIGGEDEPATADQSDQQQAGQQDPAVSEDEETTTTGTSEPAETETQASNLTAGQQNALDKADDYLRFTSFSHDGLVEQLEFEGFTA